MYVNSKSLILCGRLTYGTKMSGGNIRGMRGLALFLHNGVMHAQPPIEILSGQNDLRLAEGEPLPLKHFDTTDQLTNWYPLNEFDRQRIQAGQTLSCH